MDQCKTVSAAVLAGMLVAVANAQGVPRIPMRAGLVIVTAVHESDGDYESIKTIVSENASSLRLKYSAEAAVPSDILDPPSAYVQFRPHPSDPDQVIQMTTVYRTMFRNDLKTADHYLRIFPAPPAVPESVPGTTAVGISARVLNQFKQSGAADLTTYLAIFDPQPLISIDGDNGPQAFAGRLQRVDKSDVELPVIVNGRLVKLPTIRVKGEMLATDAEFWFLDDPDNPLAIRYAFDDVRLNVIRINFPGDGGTTSPTDGGSTGLEQSLAATGHAVVYGIYFGFNSDVIRSESEPVLREIAALMTKHPDWKLHVDGHTDNVGGAASNLVLSKRRSAAVKKNLVERFHLDAARLVTDGYGLSMPKGDNDTLEGRALNRRVELSKE